MGSQNFCEVFLVLKPFCLRSTATIIFKDSSYAATDLVSVLRWAVSNIRAKFYQYDWAPCLLREARPAKLGVQPPSKRVQMDVQPSQALPEAMAAQPQPSQSQPGSFLRYGGMG